MKRYLTLLGIMLCFASLFLAQPSQGIRLSQSGLYPDGEKLAAVIIAGAGSFVGRSSSYDAEVFTAALSQAKYWGKSGEEVAIADSSSLFSPGVYYLEVEGVGRSYDLVIRRQGIAACR